MTTTATSTTTTTTTNTASFCELFLWEKPRVSNEINLEISSQLQFKDT